MKTNIFNIKFIALLFYVCGLFFACTKKPVQTVNSSPPVQAQESETQETGTAARSFTGTPEKNKVIEIKEKLFLAQVNDIYLNQDDYLGCHLKLQGLFKIEPYGGDNACFVLRYGPGCCGNDGNAGFEVIWEKEHSYPKQDDWVEAAGTLKTYNLDGYNYLYLALSELNVLEKRGAEFVSQ
ncbi:MAG: hypothetical protein LBG79_00580 [Spirochaetaceae bacterium]|jgi:putative membrane protein|nr:hypothetical protein [Spirochaetaceae bacterium]